MHDRTEQLSTSFGYHLAALDRASFACSCNQELSFSGGFYSRAIGSDISKDKSVGHSYTPQRNGGVALLSH